MLKDNIKQLRKARGLSQQQLADRLHVVRQTISKWERGTSVPDADLLGDLADALHTTPNELLGPFAPATETAEAPAETLVLENSLSAQMIDYLAKFRHGAKASITALAVALVALIAAVIFFGLVTVAQSQTLQQLESGATNGFSLTGVYTFAESPSPDISIQGASICFAESKSEQFDGFWQLSGHWAGDPVTFRQVSEEPDLYQEWVTDDNPPDSPLVNGGFTRTGDPNVVILKDEEDNEVGWAHLVWTTGNQGQEGLIYVEYQGKTLCLPKMNADVAHQSSDPLAGAWGVAASRSHELTAEDWFTDSDYPCLGDRETANG